MVKKIINIGLMLCFTAVVISLIGGCSMYNKKNKNEVNEMKKEFVTMKTTLGDMKFELYPDIAPKTVENFITHAKNGYYNGVIFHRVINDFMIQGGDPTGTGRGGDSIWGRPFADEFSDDLHNFYGALSMANSGLNTNGSQFFIVQNKELPSQYIDSLNLKKDVAQQYKKLGGAPHLDGKHTVFGKMIDGFDVLDNIASQHVDFNDRPLEDVVIKTIEVSDK